ncbi:hypothetical protein Tco_0619776, partial [Tanacetum coccineum]
LSLLQSIFPTSTLPNADLPIDSNMPDLEDDSDAFSSDGIFNGAYDDENVGAVADFNNMDDTINVSPIPTLRIHKNHPKAQILGDPKSAVQTRGKIQKASSAQQALVSYISKQNRTNHKDHQNCLLACFLSQEEPKNISQALQDESWVEAMQEELLQFKLQKVWILVDLPSGKKAIGILRIKGMREDRGNQRSVCPSTPLVDLAHPTTSLMVIKALYGLHQALKLDLRLYAQRFQMSSMGELTFFLGLQVKQQPDGIFISQDKSMIGSLMYLTASRPDIMFAVCTLCRFQSHLQKSADLNARVDSLSSAEADIYANTTTKTDYVAAAKCLWGKDCYEKRLIEVIKIHTDSNVADLLTKGFDVTRFNFLVVSIGMLNLNFVLLVPELILLGLLSTARRYLQMIMVFELSAKLCNAVWFVFEGSSYGTKLVSAASFG